MVRPASTVDPQIFSLVFTLTSQVIRGHHGRQYPRSSSLVPLFQIQFFHYQISTQASPPLPLTLTPGSCWVTCTCVFVSSYSYYYNNIVTLKKGLPRKPGMVRAQYLWRLKLYLIGLCVLGLLHSYDDKNTFPCVIFFSLLCIYLTMSY